MRFNNKVIAGMSVLTAISVILVSIPLLTFPLFAAAPYLKYDPADIPILIGTFLYGPAAGLILTIIESILQGTLITTDGGWIGILMHIIATGSMVLTAGTIYSRKKTMKTAIFGLSLGIVVWVVMMVLWNLLMTPIFTGAPIEAVIALLLPVIIPFNLIKAGLNSTITFLLYKRTHKLFNRMLDPDIRLGRKNQNISEPAPAPEDANTQKSKDV